MLLASLLLSLVGTALPVALADVVTERPLPAANSYPFGITPGPDGALWFVEVLGNRIGRLTPSGALTEYPLPNPTSWPFVIAPGPDGALWFSEEFGNRIGRITTTGVITEFPLPVGGRAPAGIATGPDGSLWFTEELGALGRITPAGVITELPLPTPDSHPFGIVAGPDGAMWFTEELGNKIGRITTTGTVTEYPVPTPGASPSGIAVGPDGALWFTEELASKIGRITVGGAITEFQIPSAGSHPTSIARGPDGAMWFTEQQTQKIGRITMSGQITEFPTLSPFPSAITAGPDGAMWFTSTLGNSVGRIPVISLPPTPTGSSPTPTPLPTVGPAIGGRNFTIAPGGSAGVRLSWLPGTAQTGYQVARLNNGGLTTLPVGTPLGADVTGFVDTNPPTGLNCYVLLPLGTTPQATSDLLCTLVGFRSVIGTPEGLTLGMNQSRTATLAWNPPFGGGQDSYAVVIVGGSSLTLSGAALGISVDAPGPSCYVVAAMRGGTLLGYTDAVCGVPGFSSLGH